MKGFFVLEKNSLGTEVEQEPLKRVNKYGNHHSMDNQLSNLREEEILLAKQCVVELHFST